MSGKTSLSAPQRRKRLAALALTGAVSFLVIPSAPALASPPPSPTASPVASPKGDSSGGESVALPRMRAWTWIVADADTGAVLAGRDWKWKLPPASTLKTLTALTLVDRLQLDSQYLVRKQDTQAEGSKVGLKAGSHYTVRDLFNGMLMPSGNDAAAALASAYGGLDVATDAMQAEAERVGAVDTKVKNTSGLDEPGQVSTAYDLALILRESLKDPQLQQMYLQHHVDFPDAEPTEAGKERRTYRIWTENRFILNEYEGALGGKTGFTSQAGRTYVGAMERDGRTLIVAIMRSAESTERAVNRLFEWGFANYDNLTPVDQLVDAKPADEVQAVPAAQYDADGNLVSSPFLETSAQSSGPNTILLVLIAGAAAALGFTIWRRRHSTVGAEPRRSVPANEVDIREQDAFDAETRGR